MSQPLPTNLITGLLGSGKTTTLLHLLQHKPKEETWGVLINEFGEIDIDAALITSQTKNLPLAQVSGGCICCTAQFGLTQTLQNLLQTHPHLDRLLIEPTGLGHPAQLIDTLRQATLPRPLTLQTQLCLLDPRQLQHWDKSPVLRDLVTLADTIVLNKIDLCDPHTLKQAQNHLQTLYPPKTHIIQTTKGQIFPVPLLTQPHQSPPFVILEGLQTHQQQCQTSAQTEEPPLPSGLLKRHHFTTDTYLAIGWQLTPHAQFNRIQLKNWLTTLPLERGKGLIRTGKNWQLLQATTEHIQFNDIAWRQDNRLELILTNTQLNPLTLETQLLNTLHKVHANT